VLAALDESWVMPLSIMLIVPLCIVAALLGVHVADGDRNVFVQIGLVVLMGLATKNAILIVELARELEQQGRSTIDVARVHRRRGLAHCCRMFRVPRSAAR
jgi:multidrug efflux pump